MEECTLIGFDSAWTDNAKAPGAICALSLKPDGSIAFHPPQLATFDDALKFIDDVRSTGGPTLIALDQPTIVPNQSSMRPVERVVASLISWAGGGVQPSNRGKVGMFCDNSPIWRFLARLGAMENPEQARSAASGLHVMEVFPALALLSLDTSFCSRLGAPKYNPGRRKTFRLLDWRRVATVAAHEFRAFGLNEAAIWCANEAERTSVGKADQDRLDAMLCLLVAVFWRIAERERSMMIGSLTEGYMVCPASDEVRQRLEQRAGELQIAIR